MGYYKDKLIEEIKARGFSDHTVISYVPTIKDLIVFSKVSPQNLTLEHAKKFKMHQIRTLRRSPSTINCKVAAIMFFYNYVLGKRIEKDQLPRVKKSQTLPTILSKEEVAKLFSAAKNIKHKTILMGIYSSGLRKSELINLKAQDIDSKRMLIHIRQGKGQKDRMVPLSSLFLEQLRKYWYEVKIEKNHFLFPSISATKSYNPKTINEILDKALRDADIKKNVNVHSLRHSYATHCLEGGLNIRYIQMLLGHKNLNTTAVYTHLVDFSKTTIRSPLDSFDEQLLR